MIVEGETATPETIGFSKNIAVVEPVDWVLLVVVLLPVTELNGIVSVDAPALDAVEVLAFEPATDGLHPLVIDQQSLAASEPGDVGQSRWTRVQGMITADLPDELCEHVERLIERSPETPSSFE